MVIFTITIDDSADWDDVRLGALDAFEAAIHNSAHLAVVRCAILKYLQVDLLRRNGCRRDYQYAAKQFAVVCDSQQVRGIDMLGSKNLVC